MAERAGWARWMPGVFVLVWSTGFIVARYGMPHAPPMKFLALRYALSLALFVPLALAARAAWPRGWRAAAHLGVVGVLVHAGYLGGVWAAVKAGMGAGLIALIVGLQPLLTALWVAAVGGSVRPRQWLGLALGLGGVLLVVLHKLGGSAEASPASLALGVGALLSITVGTLWQKRYVQPCDFRTAGAVQLAAALAVTLPFAALEMETVRFTGELVGAIAWSVAVLTLGGSSLLYLLVQRGAATAVTGLLYLVPPCTALMAWVLFGEPISAATVAGTGLAALGVMLLIR